MYFLDNPVGSINGFLTQLEFYNKNLFMNFLGDFDGDAIVTKNEPRYWSWLYCDLFNLKHEFTVLFLSSSMEPNKKIIKNKIKIEV